MRFSPLILLLLAPMSLFGLREAALRSLHAGERATKFPAELVKFKTLGTKPVFTATKGEWDHKIRERGWILRENGLYKMWYTGYDGKDGLRLLGHATSKDGVEWMRHPRNPLVKDHWIEDMIVVPHQGRYYMFAEGKNDLAQLLVSADGLDWMRLGQLDVRRKNGDPIKPGPYGTPAAWVENGVWHLLYERNDLGVWLAKSKDMKIWTNVQDEPVMVPGPGDYDKHLIAVNQVVKHQGRYYAYYHGRSKDQPNWSTAIATSTDLVHWEKYPHNPLVPRERNLSSGILVHDGQGYRLYTMHPEVHLHVADQ